MLENQNIIHNRDQKKKHIGNKRQGSINIAAKYLSRKFLNLYNIKDPNKKIFNHLIQIFLYYLNYNVRNIDLIRNYSKKESQKFEFKVNLFSEPRCNLKEIRQKNIELISVDNFFYKNIKSIII